MSHPERLCAACRAKIDLPDDLADDRYAPLFCRSCWSLIPEPLQREIAQAILGDAPGSSVDTSMLSVSVSKSCSVIREQRERMKLARERKRWKKRQ